MAAPTLLGAIYLRFQETPALLAAMSGSPWLDEAPENTAFPYVVVDDHSERPSQHTTENDYQEDGTFTLHVYDDNLADAEALATLVKAAFDEKSLEITGAVPIRCQRTGYKARLDRMRSSLTKRIYEVELPYETWTERRY